MSWPTTAAKPDVGRAGTAARRHPFDQAAARPEAAYRRPRQAVFGQPCGGARSAVAAGRRRAGAGVRPARLSGQPGVAGRPRGRDANPHRHRGPGAAPLDRARRPGMAGVGGAVFRGALRRSLHLSGRSDAPLRGMGGASPHLPPHAGECLRFAMAARLSRRAARAERALSPAFDPARQPENPATSKPNTPRSCMPCSSAMPMPRSRRFRSIS